MEKMRGCQVFLDSLRLHGVSKIFGNPGTTESPLLDRLSDYPELEYIVALHEGIAVGAANFYAQATGTTALANLHVAPGLGNALGMIYGGLKLNTPLIVTAGQQDTRMRLREPLLGHDLVAMAAPVTKWSVQVEQADEMAMILQRAFKVAHEHPAGPVFIALPINVMEQETNVHATVAGERVVQHKIDEATLTQLASLFRHSKNPGIVASDDVAKGHGMQALVEFSEKIGAGVHIEFVSGRIPFPSKHVNYRGRLGPDHATMRHALGDYDLVLLIGGAFFEEIWYSPASPFSENTTVVQLEAGSSRLASNFPLKLGVSGDIAHALARLTQLVGDDPSYQQRAAALATRKAQENEKAQERLAALWERQPMTPARALHELGKALPEHVVIADESITAIGDVVQSFPLGECSNFYAGRGGGIGQGVAGALGTAIAHPNRPVVGISGDGSAMYSIQALWTAAHHQLNILFVILSNREYRVLKHNLQTYRQRFDAPSNKPYPHMDLSNPLLGFATIANGMGVPAQTIEQPDDIKDAVNMAMKTEGPYLIDLIVEGLESKH